MKKIDLIHTTILIVGILAGYSAVQSIVSLLGSFAYAARSEFYRGGSIEVMVSYLIEFFLQCIACVVLVRNGRKYAGMVLRDEPEASWEDAPAWDLDRRNMLLVLFVGLGLYILSVAIPFFLRYAWDIFRYKVTDASVFRKPIPRTDYLEVELFRIVIGVLLIYAAPALTNLIDKHISMRLKNPPVPD
jgi:hypothetical protein